MDQITTKSPSSSSLLATFTPDLLCHCFDFLPVSTIHASVSAVSATVRRCTEVYLQSPRIPRGILDNRGLIIVPLDTATHQGVPLRLLHQRENLHWASVGPVHPAVNLAGAIAGFVVHNRVVYVVGPQGIASLDMLTGISTQDSLVPEDVVLPTTGFAAIAHGSKIYLLGGRYRDGEPCRRMLSYDPSRHAIVDEGPLPGATEKAVIASSRQVSCSMLEASVSHSSSSVTSPAWKPEVPTNGGAPTLPDECRMPPSAILSDLLTSVPVAGGHTSVSAPTSSLVAPVTVAADRGSVPRMMVTSAGSQLIALLPDQDDSTMAVWGYSAHHQSEGWQRIDDDLPSLDSSTRRPAAARQGAAVVHAEGKVYMIGGSKLPQAAVGSTRAIPTNECWAFDLRRCAWDPSLPPLSSARTNATATAHCTGQRGTDIVVAGGFFFGVLNTVERLRLDDGGGIASGAGWKQSVPPLPCRTQHSVLLSFD